MAANTIPTLLVGLGGTGCRIVDRVLARAREVGADRGRRLEFIGFDTDVNDLAKLVSLEERRQFAISDSRSVAKVAEQHQSRIASWLIPPAQLPADIRRMTLDRGAGQLRFLTRLALFDRASTPEFVPQIRAACTSLTRLDGGDAFRGSMNIYVTGSLAGGTGSGSFLPITLLVDEICRTQGASPRVYGLFLMADVFVKTGALPVKQIPNVRANTYAALAELNAVNGVTGRRGGIESLNYEYLPDRRLVKDGAPFENIILIDYENDSGGNLGRDPVRYEEMAARALFANIFTPIGPKTETVSANDIIDKTGGNDAPGTERAAGDVGRFVNSIGVTAIAYPDRETLEFLTTRFARENLRGDWLELDRLFQDRLLRYYEERRTNPRVRQPDRGISYLEDFHQLARSGSNPFFETLRANLYPSEDPYAASASGRAVGARIETFLDAFETQILEQFWQSAPIVREARDQVPIDEGMLGSKVDLVEAVRRFEQRLEGYWRATSQAALDRPDAIVRTELASSSSLTAPADLRPHHLQTYLFASKPHPVEARVFLYALRDLVAARDAALNPEQLRVNLFGLAATFDKDWDETKALYRNDINKVLATARGALEGRIGAALFGNSKLKRFVGDFVTYYADTLEGLRGLAAARVRKRIYTQLRTELDLLVEMSEGMFNEVNALFKRLEVDDADLTTMHEARDATATTGTIQVYADRLCREEIWTTFAKAAAGRRQDEQANLILGQAFWAAYREARASGRKPSFEALLRGSIVEEFARKTVTSEFRSHYELDVMTAVQRQTILRASINAEEAKERGETPRRPGEADWLADFRVLVGRARDYAEPFLAVASNQSGQSTRLWAMNPKVRQAFAATSDFEQTFSTSQGVQIIERPEFGPTEILCVNTRVNMTLPEVKKLNPGLLGERTRDGMAEGIYHEEYRRRIERILEAEFLEPEQMGDASALTPHVDLGWHKPGRLTPIFEAESDAFERQLYRSFVIAKALDLVEHLMPEGRGAVVYLDLTTLSGGRGRRLELVESRDDWRILQALRDRSEVFKAIGRIWQERLSRIDPAAASSTPSLVRSPAITESALCLGLNRVDGGRRDVVIAELLFAQYLLISELIDRLRPTATVYARRDEVREIMGANRAQALGRMEEQGGSQEILRQLAGFANQAAARFDAAMAL